MSSATDRLRAMLDERGVPWKDYGYENHTWWGEWHAENRSSANGLFLKVEGVVTPEQAIAATLGSGTCHMKEVNLPTFGGHSDGYFIVCSECAFAIYERRSWSPIKYCPNCGAKVVDRQMVELGIEVPE